MPGDGIEPPTQGFSVPLDCDVSPLISIMCILWCGRSVPFSLDAKPSETVCKRQRNGNEAGGAQNVLV